MAVIFKSKSNTVQGNMPALVEMPNNTMLLDGVAHDKDTLVPQFGRWLFDASKSFSYKLSSPNVYIKNNGTPGVSGGDGHLYERHHMQNKISKYLNSVSDNSIIVFSDENLPVTSNFIKFIDKKTFETTYTSPNQIAGGITSYVLSSYAGSPLTYSVSFGITDTIDKTYQYNLFPNENSGGTNATYMSEATPISVFNKKSGGYDVAFIATQNPHVNNFACTTYLQEETDTHFIIGVSYYSGNSNTICAPIAGLTNRTIAVAKSNGAVTVLQDLIPFAQSELTAKMQNVNTRSSYIAMPTKTVKNNGKSEYYTAILDYDVTANIQGIRIDRLSYDTLALTGSTDKCVISNLPSDGFTNLLDPTFQKYSSYSTGLHYKVMQSYAYPAIKAGITSARLHCWISDFNGSRYLNVGISEMPCSSRTAGKCELFTYKIDPTDSTKLTFIKRFKVSSNNAVRTYYPLNPERTKIAAVYDTSFDIIDLTVDGYTTSSTQSITIKEMTLDEIGRLWIYDDLQQLHIFTPATAATVQLKFSSDAYTYTGSPISSSIIVNAYNVSGVKIQGNVKINLIGTAVKFDDGTTTKTIKTSASGDTIVPIVLSGPGYINANASLII